MEIRKNIYYWKSDRPYADGNVQVNDKTDDEWIKAELKQYLANYFKSGDFSILPGSGQGNHKTYVVKHGDETYFARLENGPEKDDYMDVESQIIGEVNKIGIPSPIVNHSDGTREQVPFAIQLLNYVDYSDLNNLYKKNELDLDTIAPKIGNIIARYQHLTFENYGLFSPELLKETNQLIGYHKTYSDYYFLNWQKHLDYLFNNGFLTEDDVLAIQIVVDKNKHFLDVSKGCLVHKDLALWNILGSSTEIVAVIDWDDAISGDPTDDISLLACFHPGKVILNVMEGYQQVKPLPENFEKRFWLHLLRNIIFKSIIRIRGGYFNMGKDFFLLSDKSNATSFKDFTYQRVLSAIKGLKGEKQIAELE